MKLIVGLGNPGFRYRYSRHNIGFVILDRIAKDFKIRIKERISNSLCGRGKIDTKEAMLVKPLTYMNLSGKVVSEIKESKNIPLEDLLIIMDDIDLAIGKIRLRPKGSSGGHKGLASIIEELGSEDFPRLRVGIGPAKKQDILSDYVLAPFKRGQRKRVSDLMGRCSDCVKTWVNKGIDVAMNRFNPTK